MQYEEFWKIFILFFRVEYLYYAVPIILGLFAIGQLDTTLRAKWLKYLASLVIAMVALPFVWFVSCSFTALSFIAASEMLFPSGNPDFFGTREIGDFVIFSALVTICIVAGALRFIFFRK